MNNDAVRRLDCLEDDIRELKAYIDELRSEKQAELNIKIDPLEIYYPSVLDDNISSTVPRWVKDMFLGECAELFASRSEEKFHSGRMSTAHAIRFLIYYAIKHPDSIDYVSLRQLRELKNSMDND